MDMQKNIPSTLEYQANIQSKHIKKVDNENMSVDEYIALVKKALDERYENIQG